MVPHPVRSGQTTATGAADSRRVVEAHPGPVAWTGEEGRRLAIRPRLLAYMEGAERALLSGDYTHRTRATGCDQSGRRTMDERGRKKIRSSWLGGSFAIHRGWFQSAVFFFQFLLRRVNSFCIVRISFFF